jgi:hypothetical protein
MLPVQVLTSQAMKIQFTTRIFKEGRSYVAHALELDVSSATPTSNSSVSRGPVYAFLKFRCPL